MDTSKKKISNGVKYQTVIGLEIHIELNTKSKMFCSCENNPFERDVNFNICPVCTAQPGSLPVINKEAVRKTIKTGLSLNCKVDPVSKFDRKNYFYPDLPKGYQISQYDAPLCRDGYLEIPSFSNDNRIGKSQIPNPKSQMPTKSSILDAIGTNPKSQIPNSKQKKIRIRRVHLEEDTGKLIHSVKGKGSLVDFNRAGVPLMELVTEPDINSAKEARKFAEELRLISRYLGISDADMEKGQMRVEVNISLKKGKTSKLGTKVEIKNLNSFRSVEKAVDYEIKRQAEILDKGKKVIQETRGWNDIKQETFSQREKEEAHDYRYFPEPDLPTLNFTKDFIEKIEAEIPELPSEKRERFKKEYGLDEKTIEIFVFYKDLGEYFEKVMSELESWVKEAGIKEKAGAQGYKNLAKIASNYITTDLQALVKAGEFVEEKFKITPEDFAEFITLIEQGKLSSKMAKQVLGEMFKTGADPSHIIEEKGLIQMTDETEIEKIVKDIISKNQKAVDDYKKGKQNALQFLVGLVMAVTKGRVNPEKTRELLKKLLSE